MRTRAIVSPLHLDDRIANHEIGHAVVAFLEGFSLIWCNANRHTLDDNYGEVSYIAGREASHEARARVALAGSLFEPSTPSRSDRERAQLLWALAGSPEQWIEAREHEVNESFRRRDVRRATRALAEALVENGRILSGPEAERVLRAHLSANE